MSWSVIATAAIVFVAGVTCSPIDVTPPATELLPPKDDSSQAIDFDSSTPATDLVAPDVDMVPTLSTDLLPPKIDSESTYDTTGVASATADNPAVPSVDLLPPVPPSLASELSPPLPSPKNKRPATLFLINVFAVKNRTAEDSNDVLHPVIMQEVPDDATSEPLAMFVLVVEDEDENKPVSLDEVAKDLEAEGFIIEKIGKDGMTSLLKVNLDSILEKDDLDSRKNTINRVKRDLARESEGEPEASGKLVTVRTKRHLLEKLLQKHGGYGCNGGCGGGYYPQPPVYSPPVYAPPPPPRPPPQPYCDPCQNGYGHGGNGGGNGYASAQATAHATATSYGK
ncbi:uncharacterized protein LOC106643707 [Copidosoma floridanum]|uniref:uncharacterized protein LOC106643707 n=1 Tax=Copidosoma floridanum TaxID=29053 RepID=UPI0006C98EAB|nr:uncharacterized protein LOC106643707 [Copidosoma floridanum]